MELWEFVLAMVIVLPIMVLWLGCIIDAIARPDLNGWSKALWVLFILFLPIVGSLTYIMMRPRIIAAPSTYDEVWGSNADGLATSNTRADPAGNRYI